MAAGPTIHASYEGGIALELKAPDPVVLSELVHARPDVLQYAPEWWPQYLGNSDIFTEKVLGDARFTPWGVHIQSPDLPDRDRMVGMAGHFLEGDVAWRYTYLFLPEGRQTHAPVPRRVYFGTEVARIVTADLFLRSSLPGITTHVHKDNAPSLAMMERLGMAKDPDFESPTGQYLFRRERPSVSDAKLLTMIQALGGEAVLAADYVV